MSSKRNILSFLKGLLGSYDHKSKGNVAFECPFCSDTKGKKKLEIHSEEHVWSCWVCRSSGRNLFSLLRKMGVSQEYYTRLNRLIPDKKYRFLQETDETPASEEEKPISLPSEFIPLWEYNNSKYYQMARDYLMDVRGVTEIDLYRYRLGYCASGKYSGMIIIPNYDGNGNVNYYTTRRFFGNPSKKFINPPAQRNIVGFEMQLNWGIPLILTESALDAISIRLNASPLYGSGITDYLKRRIFLEGVKDIVICMDSEPRARNKAIKYSEMLMGYDINVNVTILPDDTDPNELGYQKVWKYIKSSTESSDFNLFELQMKTNLLH